MKATLWAMVTASVFVGVTGVFCAGCGKSDAQQVNETARTFMSGMANDDRTLVEGTLTGLARQKMQEGETSAPNKEGIGHDGYTIGTPHIDGESASVPVTVTKNDGATPPATDTEVKPEEDARESDKPQTETVTLKFRRENGAWKIWAMRVPFIPGGSNLTMDFEHPEAVVGDAFKGIGEGVGAAMKGFGQGMGAMFKGMAEGAKAAESASATHHDK